tara:strand:+ start:66 stop:314 length:249 start_codon:yes stop_codon:yes gene_type:complete
VRSINLKTDLYTPVAKKTKMQVAEIREDIRMRLEAIWKSSTIKNFEKRILEKIEKKSVEAMIICFMNLGKFNTNFFNYKFLM